MDWNRTRQGFRSAIRRIALLLLGILIFAAGWVSGVAMGGGRTPAMPDVATRQGAAVDGLPGLAIPVAGVPARAIRNSWHDARGGGARRHEGIDIIAPGGTPVLAAHAGTIEKLFESRLGGTTLYLRSHDKKWVSYYAHLSGYAPDLAPGRAVKAGQQIAFVGDTGDAGPGNTHLHFALHRMAPGERWYQGTPVNPYPALRAAR